MPYLAYPLLIASHHPDFIFIEVNEMNEYLGIPVVKELPKNGEFYDLGYCTVGYSDCTGNIHTDTEIADLCIIEEMGGYKNAYFYAWKRAEF